MTQSLSYYREQRLSRAAGGYGTQNFTYDGVGNRLTKAPDNAASGEITTYHYQQWTNHLTGEGQHPDAHAYWDAAETSA